MAAHWTENTRTLKLLIAVMTTLLVAGLIALIYGMARTTKEMSAQFGDVGLKLPAGTRLSGLSSGDGRLYLALDHADGGQSVLVLDAATGKRLGELRLEPGR